MAKKPTPKPATELATGIFIATGTILHNGETFGAGDELEDLTEAEAAALVASGAVTTPPTMQELVDSITPPAA